ncbi:MAG: class I SAM-dependent methyltransferase [Thermoanaerobaculum sp.]|nr:class I SAM-dependent methyltransferase [Thermoanaerobaculum sp.]MDW7968652.1 class I SAM-dependent methyltransferase [Thermoanaerobaculum sp.]
MPKAQWGEDAEFFGPRHEHRIHRLVGLLASAQPGWHLECAAGLGSLAAALARRGFRVVAVDTSLKSLLVARNLRQVRFCSVVADATRLPFRPAIFASASSSETLEHLEDDRQALRELERVLRPGGVLVGSVPYDPAQWSAWDEWAGHHRRYTQQDLRDKLRQAGFAAHLWDYGFPLLRLYDSLFLSRVNRRRLEIAGPAVEDRKLSRVAWLGRWRWLVRLVCWVFSLDRLWDGSGRGVGLLFMARKGVSGGGDARGGAEEAATN